MRPIESKVLLALHTTIQLGGAAAHFVRCTSIKDIAEALLWAKQRGLPVHILGGGSNTVFPDSGFPGLVINIALKGLRFIDDGDVVRVHAAAGEEWDRVVVKTLDRGLCGLESLSGIPGYVGAVPMQNVGAYGQEVSRVIERVFAIDRATFKTVEFSGEQCDFSYRQSRFKGVDRDQFVITKVILRLPKDGPLHVTYPELRAAVESTARMDFSHTTRENAFHIRQCVLALRRKKSMVVDPLDPNTHSCGSFFLNPVLTEKQFNELQGRAAPTGAGEIVFFNHEGAIKVSAAWLIEHAGFRKGERRGGVGISQNHTLALVNYEGTTKQLVTFANEIQDKVHEIFGVRLAIEPVIVRPAGL